MLLAARNLAHSRREGRMSKMEEALRHMRSDVATNGEAKLGRPLTTDERSALDAERSLMFLEAVDRTVSDPAARIEDVLESFAALRKRNH